MYAHATYQAMAILLVLPVVVRVARWIVLHPYYSVLAAMQVYYMYVGIP